MHTIIQFLVKSHFHMFSLSYRNLLGSKFLLSLAKLAKLEQGTDFFFPWSQSFGNIILLPVRINLEVW